MRLISVSDEEHATLMHYTEPLLPVDRSAFLHDVADALSPHPVIVDDVITHIARGTQRKFRRPPDLAYDSGTSKYR